MAWIKIVQKHRLESTEHKNGEDSNFRFGQPLDSNEFRGVAQKMTFIYLEDCKGKNCLKKHFLQSAEHING